MKIIRHTEEMLQFCKQQRLNKLSVGFVPTMGALHDGHLELVRRSKVENDLCIVSVFVNPRQFNDKKDFNLYPTDLQKDIDLLNSVDCDVLFSPDTIDIFKDYSGYIMDFGGLDQVLEGEFRPGHFQGVVDIVYRLFFIIQPDNSYFGEKDYQQLQVIKRMNLIAGFQTKIVACPIVRERSGLAMSSRNKRLSETKLKYASRIYAIIEAYDESRLIEFSPEQAASKIKTEIDNTPFLKTEYVAFCEPNTLKSVYTFEKGSKIVMCIAVYCGKVRLIDNKVLQF